jgi:hypothetical protein
MTNSNMAWALRFSVMIGTAQKLPRTIQVADSKKNIGAPLEDVGAHKNAIVVSKFLHMC